MVYNSLCIENRRLDEWIGESKLKNQVFINIISKLDFIINLQKINETVWTIMNII